MKYTYSSRGECFKAILYPNGLLFLSISSKNGETLFEKELKRVGEFTKLKDVFDNYLIKKSKRDIDRKEGIVYLAI